MVSLVLNTISYIRHFILWRVIFYNEKLLKVFQLVLNFQRILNFFQDQQAKLESRELPGYHIDELQFGYRFFPKTASSSFKSLLFECENGKSFEGDKRRKHIHQWTNENRMQDISHCKIRLVIIRDPVKRFVSAYGDRVRAMKQLNEPFVRERQPELLDQFTKFNPSLSEFIAHFDFYRRVNVIDHHTKPVVLFLNGHGLHRFTDVFKFEDLDKAHQRILEITGKNVGLKQMKARKKLEHLSDLNERELDFLIDYYKDDYKLMKGFYSPRDIKEEWSGFQK